MKYVFILLLLSSFSLVASDLNLNENCRGGICEIFRVTDSVTKRVANNTNVSGSDGGVILVDTEPKTVTKTCWKAARMPRPIYDAIIKMMKSLGDPNEDTPVVYTPAQQTMLLFYNTLMQQTLNFKCSK